MNNKMTRNIIWIVIGILMITSVIQVVRNPISLGLMVVGIGFLLFSKTINEKQRREYAIFGGILIGLSFFANFGPWLLLALIIVLFISDNQGIYQSAKEALFSKKLDIDSNEFVNVDLENEYDFKMTRKKNPWIHQNTDENEIYEWDDVNYSKFLGDSVVDLANTLVPKDTNIILIRKGFGRVKILVPQEVAASLSINIMAGTCIVGSHKMNLVNETYYFRSQNYDESSRKLKIAISLLFGEVEVVLL